MSEPWFEEWVSRAEEDYLAASSLDPGQTPRVICFHCQQCIEKYLKAALVRHGIPIQRTHDLVVLIGLLEARDPRFRGIVGPARHLSAFSVEVRYPGADVDEDLASEAVEIVRDLRGDIRGFLDL